MGKLCWQSLEVDPVLSSINLSLPVTILLWAFGSNFLLVFRQGCVFQEASIKAIFRDKILNILDSCWGL